MSRKDSDEAYVLDMCDEVLGEVGQQGHRFYWLLGDPGATGRQVKLPVDSYWPGHQLVVEYLGAMPVPPPASPSTSRPENPGRAPGSRP